MFQPNQKIKYAFQDGENYEEVRGDATVTTTTADINGGGWASASGWDDPEPYQPQHEQETQEQG